MPDKIGTRRVYLPGQRPTIYPGEQADCLAQITREEFQLHARTGFAVDLTNHATVHVTPMPGFYGWMLRTRWRLFGSVPLLLVAAFALNMAAIAVACVRLVAGDVGPKYLATTLSVTAFVLVMISRPTWRKRHARRSR